MSASPVALRVFERVQSLLPPRFKHTWCMITAAASTAAGHGPSWLPVIYREAVKDLGAPPSKDTISPLSWTLDHPRRRISRQLKETLLKSTILIGVGQCIEASFALGEALEEGDRDHVLVREGFDTDGKAMERGDTGLGRIYQHNILAIDRKMFELGLMDIQWLSHAVTYGQILTVTRPEHPSAALDVCETGIVSLTCLLARNTGLPVLWHLRGLKRAGLSNEEVEACQQAIEICIEGLRSLPHDSRARAPRVTDVKDEDDF